MFKSWGVVQSVGHLTVNEDGVGSSPTAPANCLPPENPKLVLSSGKAGFRPAAPAAVHGDYVAVAHFLQVVGGKRRTVSASAIKHHRGVFIRNGFLDVALDD